MSVSASPATPSAPFPCGPIHTVSGRGVAVSGDDIDTDRIIPARFLKCVTFEGLAAGAFADDRAERSGDHPFDRPHHQGARILVVNRNFGCGSSREHAPQALMRWGIRAVIGESFAEIFFGNCLALGIPCLTASHEGVAAIQTAIVTDPAVELVADLNRLELRLERSWHLVELTGEETASMAEDGPRLWPLGLAGGAHRMLLGGGWDGTSQLVENDLALRVTAARLPYLSGFA